MPQLRFFLSHAQKYAICIGIFLHCVFLSGSALASPPTPQKIFAVSQIQPSGVAEVPSAPSDSIVFYDVTDIGHGATSGVFNNDPLFSVWMGYEIFEGEQNDLPEGLPRGNREEFSAFTVNPANGTIYAMAFDSGSPPNVDTAGDTQGDFDLDGDVDSQDFLIYQRSPQFDAWDLADWQTNYGFSSMAPLATSKSIPEPASIPVGMLGLAGILFTRTRRIERSSLKL